MLKIPLALVPGVILLLTTVAAAQTFPANLPIAITCYAQHDKSWHVTYLHRVEANGDAVYVAANGKLTGTVNAKGVVVMPTNRPANIDCYGKTLDELRTNGRVMDFQRAR